ncbi:PREDICTED: uncharacterized protein LOC104588767 [Nelumbo nucifera]|uniref:Uncharacterized protein LOC104588767 n=1 Tax=Nelumbo nucifera TaxID=4432 RepID=A0A1U7YX86_NELNU|nr:PREDICTED: uncharacterized protein LOC104588767 [Nelumbo nucifera]
MPVKDKIGVPREGLEIGEEKYKKWPKKLKKNPQRVNPKKYYKFHRGTSHDTKDCFDLKNEIESFIHRGHLKQYVGGEPSASSSQQQPQQHQQVASIKDGSTALGGASVVARKAYARQLNIQGPTPKKQKQKATLSFTSEDLKGFAVPHEDALVISAIIAKFVDKRILVDSGSSADILFYEAFEKMRIAPERLQAADVPLVGFSNNVVRLEGKITPPLTVGMKPKQATRMTKFLVVRIGSPYNAITGRPTLYLLQAAISSYHLALMFPTKHSV